MNDLYTKDENDNDGECAWCTFLNSYLLKELAALLHNVAMPCEMSAEDMLELLNLRSYYPPALEVTTAGELVKEVCMVKESLSTLFYIDYEHFQDDKKQQIMKFSHIENDNVTIIPIH